MSSITTPSSITPLIRRACVICGSQPRRTRHAASWSPGPFTLRLCNPRRLPSELAVESFSTCGKKREHFSVSSGSVGPLPVAFAGTLYPVLRGMAWPGLGMEPGLRKPVSHCAPFLARCNWSSGPWPPPIPVVQLTIGLATVAGPEMQDRDQKKKCQKNFCP